MPQSTIRADIGARRLAFRFVLLIGILSFFADFTYEGSRSILGPFLASLQASGTVVGVVTGFGEMLGYGLRLVSGRFADATGRFWPITISWDKPMLRKRVDLPPSLAPVIITRFLLSAFTSLPTTLCFRLKARQTSYNPLNESLRSPGATGMGKHVGSPFWESRSCKFKQPR